MKTLFDVASYFALVASLPAIAAGNAKQGDTAEVKIFSGKVTVRSYEPVIFTDERRPGPAALAVAVEIVNNGRDTVRPDRSGIFILDRTEHGSTFPVILDSKGRNAGDLPAVGHKASAKFTLLFTTVNHTALDRFDLYLTLAAGKAKDQAILHYKAPDSGTGSGSKQAGAEQVAPGVAMAAAAYRALKNLMYGDRLGDTATAGPIPGWRIVRLNQRTVPLNGDALGQ